MTATRCCLPQQLPNLGPQTRNEQLVTISAIEKDLVSCPVMFRSEVVGETMWLGSSSSYKVIFMPVTDRSQIVFIEKLTYKTSVPMWKRVGLQVVHRTQPCCRVQMSFNACGQPVDSSLALDRRSHLTLYGRRAKDKSWVLLRLLHKTRDTRKTPMGFNLYRQNNDWDTYPNDNYSDSLKLSITSCSKMVALIQPYGKGTARRNTKTPDRRFDRTYSELEAFYRRWNMRQWLVEL